MTFYYKIRQILLQNVTNVYYKIRQVLYKMQQLLQSARIITKCIGTIILKHNIWHM